MKAPGQTPQPTGPPESAGSGDRRWLLLRLLDRLIDRKPGGAPHPLRRQLARWFGRDPDRFDQRTECRQCGHWESVTVLRQSARRARYWCQHCGAVVRLTDLTVLRPVGKWREESQPPPPPAAPPTEPQLPEVMPAAMITWANARSRKPLRLERLDRAMIYQLYRQWDAHLAQAEPDQLAALVGPGEPAPVAGLAAFSSVVGALHDRCYRTDLVVETLHRPRVPDGQAPPAADLPAQWQRVEHARRWLALRGQDLCWIHSTDDRAAAPDRGEVKAAIAALRCGEDLGKGPVVAAVRAALFGTSRGPGLPKIRAVYPVATMIAALEQYLESGARPLREEVLGWLTAPATPPPVAGSSPE